MPNTLLVNDILAVRFYSNMAQQYSVNVRHYRVFSINAGVPTDFDVAVRMDAIFAPVFKALQSQGSSYYGTSAQVIGPIKRPPESTTSSTGPGDEVSDPLPPQVCGLISLRTALAGPKNRGRLFIPFPPETDSGTGARPDIDYLANANALLSELLLTQTLINSGRSVTITPVLYHRELGTTDPLTSGLVRNNWATQRRRSFVNRPDVPPF